MLKNLNLVGDVLSNIIAAVKVPVTIKIRAGWDENSIVGPEIVQIAEKAGAQAICVHGRTREQGYKGKANWQWIRECKQAAKKIIVIGNGDLFDAQSVEKMFVETGCDAALLSRGTFGSPWIIEDVYNHLSGAPIAARTAFDYRDALLEHLEFVRLYHAPRKAAMDLRRIGCWYLKKGQGTRRLRESLNKSRTLDEIRVLIREYPWHETDFSTPELMMEEA